MSVNGYAAGHEFVNGVCVKPGCCVPGGVRWVDIRNTLASETNQPGIAHSGYSTSGEIESIHLLAKAEDAKLAAATGWKMVVGA